jgi:nucleoside 2-deoxyribosyltransferase
LIAGQGIEVISPLHDIGEGPTELVVPADLAALRRSTAVLALLDGEDSGTLFEVGFARALGKPVIGYAEHPDAEALKMVAGSGCQLFDDVASAIYSLVWS